MRKIIKATAQVRSRIKTELGVTDAAVSLALSYQRSGRVSLQIRKLALEYGAEVLLEGQEGEFETLHESECMIQTFPNGAKLIANKGTGDVSLEFQGKCVATYHDVRVSDMSNIQAFAARLS